MGTPWGRDGDKNSPHLTPYDSAITYLEAECELGVIGHHFPGRRHARFPCTQADLKRRGDRDGDGSRGGHHANKTGLPDAEVRQDSRTQLCFGSEIEFERHRLRQKLFDSLLVACIKT